MKEEWLKSCVYRQGLGVLVNSPVRIRGVMWITTLDFSPGSRSTVSGKMKVMVILFCPVLAIHGVPLSLIHI